MSELKAICIFTEIYLILIKFPRNSWAQEILTNLFMFTRRKEVIYYFHALVLLGRCHRTHRSPLYSPGSGGRYVYHPLGHTNELRGLVGSCGAVLVFSYFLRIFSAFSRVSTFCAFLFSLISFCACVFKVKLILMRLLVLYSLKLRISGLRLPPG